MGVNSTSSSVIIENYRVEDFDVVFGLLQQLWPTKKLDSALMRKMLAEASESDSRVLLCARLDGKVVGFGSMTFKSHLWHEGNIGWVDELVVDSNCRGKGVGRLVLDRLFVLAKNCGCRAIELDSSFHRVEAHKFYETLGFERRAFLFFKKLDS